MYSRPSCRAGQGVQSLRAYGRGDDLAIGERIKHSFVEVVLFANNAHAGGGCNLLDAMNRGASKSIRSSVRGEIASSSGVHGLRISRPPVILGRRPRNTHSPTADQTFDDLEAAIAWMGAPQRFCGRVPRDVIATREGQDEVRRLLRLIDFGDYV